MRGSWHKGSGVRSTQAGALESDTAGIGLALGPVSRTQGLTLIRASVARAPGICTPAMSGGEGGSAKRRNKLLPPSWPS